MFFLIPPSDIQKLIILGCVVALEIMSQELDDAKIEVRKSNVREEIVRELYQQSDLRPTEIRERIEGRVDTTKENFYQNLKALTEDIVERTEGSRRMTLYSLTDVGEQVAEELELTKDEREQFRGFAFQSPLTVDEMEEVIEEIRGEKTNDANTKK